ncbi:MAG: response regulator [Melioribacteraceae bacterium]
MYTKPKILFVDDEKQIIDGFKRGFHTYRNEWDLFYALSGEEALNIIEGNQINVVISDMRMPGMNGAELLAEVKKKHPETIRIILSGHSDEEMIMKSVNVAHQFLSKPCDKGTLIETINRTFHVRQYLRNDHLIKLINGIEELPRLPQIFVQLENMFNSDNISLNKVAELISKDVGLSAKILQIVNSAFFGLPTKIADLEQAVGLLGINIIKSLLLFLELHKSREGADLPSAFLTQIFNHSLKVATYSKIIYEYEKGGSIACKEAYAAGLLHDIGKLVLIQLDGYKTLLVDEENQSIHELEYEKFNVTHAEVGAYLLTIWNLPSVIVEAVAFHHSAIKNDKFDMSVAVHFANQFAKSKPEAENEVGHSPFEGKIEIWKKLCDLSITI